MNWKFQIKKKLFLTDPNGKHFIRYEHKRFKLFIAILDFDAPVFMQQYIDAIISDNSNGKEDLITAKTELNGKYYLLHAIDHEIMDDNRERAFKKIAFTMRRLADSYRYAFLIPIAQGRQPDFAADFDEQVET